MRTYAEYAPTSMDTRGLALPDRQDWLVGPCGRTRDSGNVETANWRAQIARLGESDDVEIHRFGHWACGWLELVLVRPGSPAAMSAAEIEAGLADHPIVDEETLSDTETEARNDAWGQAYGGAHYVAEHIAERCGFYSPTRARFRDMCVEAWDVVACAYDAQPCPEYDDDGCATHIQAWIRDLSRDDLARLIRSVRARVRGAA